MTPVKTESPKWFLTIFLSLAGVLLTSLAPLHSEQADAEKPAPDAVEQTDHKDPHSPDAPGHHEVSKGVTILFTLILAAMILCLALEEKIHAKKSLIVGCFCVLSLFLGALFHLLPFKELTPITIGGHQLNIPVYIPGIDWGVIAIILGSSLFVDVTSKSGLFTWIAIKLTKTSKGDPVKLLWFYGVMTVVFSAVLNNVTAMIIVGSLTGVSLSKLEKRDMLLGFLVIEGLLTNIGGLLTLISSVPNIIVGTAANIPFVTFFIVAAPYVLVATVITIIMGAKLFGIKGLSTEEEKSGAAQLVEGFDENDGIESESFFWFGTIMTGLFIIVIASTSALPYLSDLGMGYVALSFAAVMLIRYKSEVDKFYQSVDWDLLGFFACLFVVINVMEHAMVLEMIGTWLKPIIEMPVKPGSAALMVAAGLASSVTDNIPLAAMLSKILGGLSDPPSMKLWWAVVFGANLGGNITPIGSASTLVAVTIIHKNKLHMSFAGFVKMAIPYAAIQLFLAAIYVVLFVG
jgi:Na+/H+ antiporter NhaD/arsenite permease-like protein